MPREKRSGVTWITKPRDIRSLKRIGRFFRGKLVLAWVSSDAFEGSATFVGVATGKGFEKAVWRNKARRRVKGCIMDSRHLLKPGTSYLIECRPGVEEAEYQKLVNEVRDILARSLNC